MQEVHAGITNKACILENMPGVKNQMAAISVVQLCKKYPIAKQGLKASDWFGPKSGPEYVLKYGKNVIQKLASVLTYRACNNLYNPPKPDANSSLPPGFKLDKPLSAAGSTLPPSFKLD